MATTKASGSTRSTSGRRSSHQPVTASNQALSKKHLRESIAFNKAHADDHVKAMKEDAKALKKVNKAKVKSAKS